MLTRSIIAVDGLAGSGKTTLSRELARRLGYVFVSSGALYRALAFLAVGQNTDLANADQVVSLLRSHQVGLRRIGEHDSGVFIDGQDVSQAIGAPQISQATSVIAQFPAVREALVLAQRGVFPEQDIIVEGRDIGTVIFPDAALKFFVQVDPQVREERRLQQLTADKGLSKAEMERIAQQMHIEIAERDARDQGRKVAPAKPAADAIIIDNGRAALTQVVQNMYDFAVSRGLAIPVKPVG